MRSSGMTKSAIRLKRPMVSSMAPTSELTPRFNLQDFGASADQMGAMLRDGQNTSKFVKARRATSAIFNAERPSDRLYRNGAQMTYHMAYAYIDYLVSDVSLMSTLCLRSVTEIFRYDLELKPRFALKCTDCGYEAQNIIRSCPVCGSVHLRRPDESQKDYFKRPNGRSFIDEANNNGQSLKDVLKSYALSQYKYNQGYILCVTGDILDPDGNLESAYPLEFLSYDPKYVRMLYDDTGTPGRRYAFSREDRHILHNFEDGVDDTTGLDPEGHTLYPAYWQVGIDYGATGDYWLYAQEEMYQDHWFTPALVYGTPIWFDIEDDLLTYHFIEKHNLRKYQYGYVRKIIVLPGFSDDDVEDITMGIKDILAKDDNSIPIICLPPQIPGTSEMKAQTLELGTESSDDLLQVKGEIRDRVCAHIGVPNLFAGDVEASGGMNNESQQITVFDRFLIDKYNYVDRCCRWFMEWFPLITDWELTLMRPSKAYTDTKRMREKMEEALQMKQLGFPVYFVDGEFRYGEEPIGQQAQRIEEEQALQQMKGQPPGPEYEQPPRPGSARREDDEIDGAKEQTEESKGEAQDAPEM